MFIVWGLLRYGVRHLATPKLREYFRLSVVLARSWRFGAAIYLLVRQGYDTSTGLVSGYMATLLMSALYIPQFFRERDRTPYSPFVAWCKLLGNGLVIGFCVLVYPENHFLQALCAITLVLDVYYVVLFHTRRAPAAAA